MNELLLLGLSHRTAPVDVRERLSATQVEVETLLAELTRSPCVHEAAILSTCNRSEIYLVVTDADRVHDEVLALVSRRSGLQCDELREHLYAPRNCDVARHLYRVASGLDSMVLGEYEVQGQVKRAYETAQRTGTSGPLLHRVFKAALKTGKRVRSQTSLSRGRTSVASVAVDLAAERVGRLADRAVMIVGAGETAELTAQAFGSQGARSIFISNRHADRARALANRFDGRVGLIDDLPDQLVDADVVISSTGSPHTVVSAEALRRVMTRRAAGSDYRPIVLIDIAVPRDIDPECASIDGVALYDIDDLQGVVARSLRGRGDEARIAEEIVTDELQVFARWLGQLAVTPTIVDLRARACAIAEDVLATHDGRWESASPADRRAVERAVRTVVQRLLHEPTVRLKAAAERDVAHAHVEVLRDLFGLDDGDTPRSRIDGGAGQSIQEVVSCPTSPSFSPRLAGVDEMSPEWHAEGGGC